ncbi:serine/threonine-protein kinase [Nocardiopsis halotolerans]|uniref:serine/threonine-protein kinase n=1 Tax=Nocardiopsis halotolerans TaxID=124252 RepID=UPI00034AABD5|nr:serine/threonine-protein kinase [Nocardiopsis halotolerans]
MKPLTSSDPRTLGGIELLGRLGQGGMGMVYVGRTSEDVPVAVKTLHAGHLDRDDLRERFDRESTALGMVQGPGVAALVAVSEPGDETPWLAMEYVPGLDLATYLERHDPLDAVTGAALGLVLASALTEIHTAGLLHRDLKPANVMLGPDGPRVVDFGLVAIGGAGGDLTVTNMRLGTPRFMAPEQFTAPTEVTAAADAYALGVVLAYATSGRYPYNGATPEAIGMAALNPDLAPELSRVPDALLPLVTELMAIKPADRPALADVRARLTEFLAAEGLSPGAARARLAERTHVKGTGITDTVPPATRPAATTRPATAPPPTGTGTRLAARTAARLRRAYARPAA